MAAIAKCMDCAVAKPATINKAVLTNSSSVNSLLVVCSQRLTWCLLQ